MVSSLCLMFAASFSLGASIMAGAKTQPPPADTPQVLVDVRLLQVDAPESAAVPLIGDIPVLGHLFRDKTPVQATPKDGKGESVGTSRSAAIRADDIRLTPIDDPLDVVVAARNWELRIGELVLSVRDGELSVKGETDGGPQPWQMLSSPRLIVSVGQEATVAVGREVPYMVRQDDGSFILERSDEKYEGIRFSVLIDTADDAAVSIKKLNLKISNMTGRVELQDVPLEIGPPIIHSTEALLSLTLNPDHTAVVALPREADDQPLIFLLLQTRVVADPGAGSDK